MHIPISVILLLWFNAEVGKESTPVFQEKDNSFLNDKILEENNEFLRKDSLNRNVLYENLLAFTDHGNSDNCLAFDIEKDSCLVNSGQYNQYLHFYFGANNFPVGISDPVETYSKAKEKIILQILKPTYLEQAFLEEIASSDSRSVSWIAASKERERLYLRSKRIEIGDSTLRQLYLKNFQSLFSEQKKRKFLRFYSSDSLLLSGLRDSILHVIGTKNAETVRKVKYMRLNGLRIACREAWGDSLSAEEHLNLDTVPLFEISRIYNAKIGFGLGLAIGEETRSRVVFDSALPALIQLAFTDPTDSAVEDGAIRNYYRSHESEFKAPDTVAIKLWLVPFITRKETDQRSFPSQERLVLDTSKIRSITTTLSEATLVLRPKNLNMGKNQRNNRLVSIRTEFGDMYVMIFDIKKGRGLMKYENAKEAIKQIMGLLTPQNRGNYIVSKGVKKVTEDKLTYLKSLYKSEISREIKADTMLARQDAFHILDSIYDYRLDNWIRNRIRLN